MNILLVNPFTKQVLNANPRGCNQWTGPTCLQESYEALKKEAGIPIIYSGTEHSPSLRRWYGEGAKIGGLASKESLDILGDLGHREVAAHEIGHLKSGHLDTNPSSENEEAEEEFEAWRWALKNRKKLALSKRKMIRLIRSHSKLDTKGIM